MNEIFDIEKIRRNRLWAKDHMDGHDFLFNRALNQMMDNLDDIQRDFKNILIVGRRQSDIIKSKLSNKNIELFDINDNSNEIPKYDVGQFDCIIVTPYLHTVNDVVGFLTAMKSYLQPDGLFLCSYFGGQSLNELRSSIMEVELAKFGGASQHIHPMIDHFQFAGLLQSVGFALPVVDYDRVIVEYSDIDNLYKDLKNMGEGNALQDRKSNISELKQDIEIIYKNNFYNNGYIATFDIVHGIGWAPHESQQKPSKRGSGQVSLTEIL